MGGSLITTAELAERFQVTPTTIRQWVRDRRIPAIKVSRRIIRFDLQDVLATLKASTTSA